MSLDSRLRRLATRARPVEPCSECRAHPGDTPRFSFGGTQHPDEPPVVYCRRCGRVVRFTLDIGGAALGR